MNEFPSAPHPPPRARWVIPVSVAAAVALVLAGAFLFRHYLEERKLHKPETASQRKEAVIHAFAADDHPSPAPLDGPEAASINHFLAEAGAATNRKDVKWLLEHHDFSLIFSLMAEQTGAPEHREFAQWVEDHKDVLMRMGEQNIRSSIEVESYERHEIRRLELNKRKDRAVAFVREIDKEGEVLRNRYWLQKKGSTWTIYDVETVDVGMRLSTMLSAMLSPGLKASPGRKALQDVLKAYLAIHSGNAAAAAALIPSLKAQPLPNELRALVLWFESGLLTDEGKFEDALKCIEEAASLQPDFAQADIVRAICLNQLKRHEEALTAAQSFIALLGPDASVLNEAGLAHEGLGQKEKALAAFTETLKEQPRNAEALACHARLADAAHAEAALSLAFKSAADADALYAEIEEHLGAKDHVEALQRLASAMKKVHPTSEAAQKTESALAASELAGLLKKDLAASEGRMRDAFKRRDAHDIFYQLTIEIECRDHPEVYRAMARIYRECQPADVEAINDIDKLMLWDELSAIFEDASDEEAAFRAKIKTLPDPEKAVRTWAAYLDEEGDYDVLEQLLTQYKKLAPNSPLIPEYEKKIKNEDGDEDEKIEENEK